MHRISYWGRRFLGALAISALLMGASAGLAAAGSPYAYRNAGNHYSPLLPAPNSPPMAWLAPREAFYMECWFDFKNGDWNNYYTVRWYRGWSKDHGWGYIHASFIFRPTKVPHC